MASHENSIFSSMGVEKREEISRGLMEMMIDDYNRYKNNI